MYNSQWIPLIEYSNKYQISISTLRRRIKDKTIPFKLDDGKYFIVDAQIEKDQRGRALSPATSLGYEETPLVELIKEAPKNNDIARLMLEELKKAYSQALHGKEEQIFQLKEEISDLKTLVRVLESEVERLNSNQRS